MNIRAVDPARSRVVLVGTSAYDGVDPMLPDVPVVANNIVDLAAVLTDPYLGGFDAAHCVVAPPGAGVAEVGDLLVQAAGEAEDLLLFYYCGHGLLSPRRRELFLTLAGTRPDRLAFTALPFDAIRDACLESRATSRVVIIDSCFSGRAIGETLAVDDQEVLGQLVVNGTYTLTSAPANRTALILPGERHTAFTARLIALLRSGSPQAGDMISLGDIYRHLHARMRAEGLSVPQQCGTETADLLGLVRNRLPAQTGYAAVAPGGPPPNSLRIPNAAERSDRAATVLEQAEFAAMSAGRNLAAMELAEVARLVAGVDRNRAIRLVEQAERDVQGPTDLFRKAEVLARAGQAMAVVDSGHAARLFRDAVDAAESIAEQVPDRRELKRRRKNFLPSVSGSSGEALVRVVSALAESDPDLAENIAGKMTVPSSKAWALKGIAQALAGADPDRAERVAESIAVATARTWALAGIARTLARTDPQRAVRLTDEAERTALKIQDWASRAVAIDKVRLAVAGTDPERAEHITEEISNSTHHQKHKNISEIAQEMAESDPDRAERIAGGITHEPDRSKALAGVARAVARVDPGRAERIAVDLSDVPDRAKALARVARALVDTDPERALRVFAEAERAGLRINSASEKALVLAEVARAWLSGY